MKLIAGVILSLSLLELFHCVPLVGNDDGSFKETNTSSSWSYSAGVDANLGFEAGWQDGHGILGTRNHFGGKVGGEKINSQKDTNYAINPVPAPNNVGSGLGHSNYAATGFPNYPAPGSPYYPVPRSPYYPTTGSLSYPAPGSVYYPDSPYYNNFASQPPQQWPTPYAQQGPQFNLQVPVPPQNTQQLDYAPQPAPQQNTREAQQYYRTQQYASGQQYGPGQPYGPGQQYGPAQQFGPGLQYAPPQQNGPVPLYVQQGAPQQVQQDAPQNGPANGTPNDNHQENIS